MVKKTPCKFTCKDVFFCYFIGRQPYSEGSLSRAVHGVCHYFTGIFHLLSHSIFLIWPHFYDKVLEKYIWMNASELMEILFWIDEFNPGMINLFQSETYPGEKSNSSDDTSIRYHNSDSWPAHPPVGMWFNYGILNDFLKEWTLRKEELKSGKITRDEYFEWKINWPQTCDDCGKREPSKQWRCSNE